MTGGEVPRAAAAGPGPTPAASVPPASPRERVLGAAYYLKGRYVRAAFRHPRLFWEGLRRPDLPYLLQRAEELEFSSPVMRAMWHASVGKPEREFTFEGRRYAYRYDAFNHAWGTERTVEVPLALALLGSAAPARTVEVGNVLGHYAPTEHRVVDKFEPGPRVINQDVVEFVPGAPVDLVVSVSTLEHVGWDEVPRDREKLPRALRRMRSWLSPHGRAWVTVPLGYNRWLDGLIASGELGADQARFLRRVSFDNRWTQCRYEEVAQECYGGPLNRRVDQPPFPRANAVGVFAFGPD